MLAALAALDTRLDVPVKLLVGGGAAMLLAHGFPISTMDIDGLVFQSAMTQVELEPHVRAVGEQLQIPSDWLNGYFNTFLFTLPSDYQDRLNVIHEGRHLTVFALSAEDLLILKCFAGRPKDVPHARSLFKIVTTAGRERVDLHLQQLLERNIPGADRAAEFFDELCDQWGA